MLAASTAARVARSPTNCENEPPSPTEPAPATVAPVASAAMEESFAVTTIGPASIGREAESSAVVA